MKHHAHLLNPHNHPPIPTAPTTPAVNEAMTALQQARHVDARKRRRCERELVMAKARSLLTEEQLARIDCNHKRTTQAVLGEV